jgi:hypothetical protein
MGLVELLAISSYAFFLSNATDFASFMDCVEVCSKHGIMYLLATLNDLLKFYSNKDQYVLDGNHLLCVIQVYDWLIST